MIKNRIDFNLLGNAQTAYNEVNVNIERWTKIIFLLLTKVSLAGCIIVPPLLITTINYCNYDLREESYFLSFPVV